MTAILLCPATIYPVAILLELDFLFLCCETTALRNTYLDHLELLRLRGKREKAFKIFIYLNFFYKLVNFIL